MPSVQCDNCGLAFDAVTGHVNRARSRGASLYCSRKCSGLARRTNKSEAQKKAEKSEYDRRRRIEKADELKLRRAESYQRNRDPVKEAAYRKSRMHKHVEYCRRPEYREKKRGYDRLYRAKKEYGEFAESFLLAQDIRSACLERQSDYEIRLAAETLNKKQNRRRDHERAYSNQS